MISIGTTQTVATLITGWHHWDNDSVEIWSQSTVAALAAGSSSTGVSQDPLWESRVAGGGRRAGWATVATGPANKGQRSHCKLCCRPAVNIWRRLPATAVNSVCDLRQNCPPQTQEKTVTALGASRGGGEGTQHSGGQVQCIFHLEQ